jgi:hypothetical protein
MYARRRKPSPNSFFVLILASFAVVLGCRASDLADSIRQRRAGATAVAANTVRPKPSATETLVALVETPTEVPTETETETLEPSPTGAPTDTPEPSETSTPSATRTPAPPTRIPPPTQTFTPAPPPPPTRCPDQLCVIKTDCLSGQDTRAIGHVYANGAPLNGVTVRVSYDYGGAPVAGDFISGHDPINPRNLWPGHDGYYQVGISEGSAKAGTWWVFVIDPSSKEPVSEGRTFTTQAQQTPDSCQIGVTDFGN